MQLIAAAAAAELLGSVERPAADACQEKGLVEPFGFAAVEGDQGIRSWPTVGFRPHEAPDRTNMTV